MRTRTKAAAAAGAAAIGLAAFTTAASAAPPPASQDIAASVTIAQELSASFSTGSLDFGTSGPGATADSSVPEVINVSTNLQNGASLSVLPRNGGWHSAPGQPDQINDSATSVTTTNGDVALSENGAVLLESVAQGQHTFTQPWHLHVPGNLAYTGPLSANFQYTVVAN